MPLDLLSLAEAAGLLAHLEPSLLLQWQAGPPHRHRRKDSFSTALEILKLSNSELPLFHCQFLTLSLTGGKQASLDVLFQQTMDCRHKLQAAAPIA